MNYDEKINTYIEAIKAINEATIIKCEKENKQVNPDFIEDYESWQAKDLKKEFYKEIGRAYFHKLENNIILTENNPVEE